MSERLPVCGHSAHSIRVGALQVLFNNYGTKKARLLYHSPTSRTESFPNIGIVPSLLGFQEALKPQVNPFFRSPVVSRCVTFLLVWTVCVTFQLSYVSVGFAALFCFFICHPEPLRVGWLLQI